MPFDLSVAAARLAALRAEGMKYDEMGERAKAVACWTEEARLQETFAAEAGLPADTRYLRGENWTNGIGHIALLDFFVKRRMLGLDNRRYVVVTTPGFVANHYYLQLWAKHIEIKFAVPVEPEHILAMDAPTVLKVEGQWHYFMDAAALVEDRWSGLALLALPQRDIEWGRDILESLGVPRNAWFVTLHMRESAIVGGTENDHTSARRAKLDTYAPAIEEIKKAGGHVVRIGAKKSPVTIPGLIDCGGAPDWLDIFLLSQCRFFMGTNSGPAWVAGTFGVPALLTNWLPLSVRYYFSGGRAYPKLFNNGHGDPVEPAGALLHLESETFCKVMGVETVANTPDEIAGWTVEFMGELS